ncbi:TlpA family protein disulfide reductase [Winogradskyella alexanderae]|uniref:TlpA family protein disulfide reductase n=1 Tax=Winogradskyella alexanderae TaxID=2877123 RepID=A0ABS7XW34_9FLAO|nr:TlpA disulfide reductase family protein [Winogradskyella alexanderae]MCA0133221.1 TlpA family protein disulfide reductase [Winogradskyella alexanderae]
MKRLIVLSLVLMIIACKEKRKDYATISGKIENFDQSKTITIFQGRNYNKSISLNDDGTFVDTLKIKSGDYNFKHGNKYGQIYLENGFESSFTTDFDAFAESIIYKGDGSDINNFTVKSFLISTEHFQPKLFSMGTKEDLETAVNSYNQAYKDLKQRYPSVDSTHLAIVDENVKRTEQQIINYMNSRLAKRTQFPKGSTSPVFTNYENYNGNNTSLEDLKGKYLYIDIWATWCGPCKVEIPSLKKLEARFKDKNIQFVSISIDDGRGYKGDVRAAYKGWKKMIKDKNLGGVQLLADNGFNSQFMKDYRVNSIPRFIILDPQGKIVNADAPRPSNPELVELLNSLNI